MQGHCWRWRCPLLVQLLASSSSAAVQAAAVTLLGFLAVDDPGTDAVVAAGALPPLVALMQHSSHAVQAAAASALGCLALGGAGHKAAILAAGAVEPLVKLLDSTDYEVQRGAVGTLRCLASGKTRKPCRAAIAAAGAIPALVRLVPVLHEHATAVLVKLAQDSIEQCEAVAAAGAGAALQPELLSNSEAARGEAAELFACLSGAVACSLVMGAVAEAATALLGCLESSSSEYALRGALDALGNLSVDDAPAVGALLPAGLLPLVQRCLLNSSAKVAASATWLLDNMARVLPANREAMGASETISALIGLLRHEAQETAFNAAWALRHLALDCPANQQAILAAGGFEALLSLLQGSGGGGSGFDSSGPHHVRGAAAMALCELAQGSERLRHAVEAAGAAAAIQQGLSAWDLEYLGAGIVGAAQEALRLLASDDDSAAHTDRLVGWGRSVGIHRTCGT